MSFNKVARRTGENMTLAHVTTVPQSLMFLRGQVEFMRERGFRIVAISSPGPQLSEFARIEQVPTFAVEMPRKIAVGSDIKAVEKLVSVLRKSRPTIVHAHTPKGGLLGMVAGKISRVPVRIYHIRGLPYMTAKGWRRTLLMATERISCALADRVFCVSHSIREVAVRDGICPPEKIVVFGEGSGNGVDSRSHFNPERFSPGTRTDIRKAMGVPANAMLVLFVGRIVRDKGVEELAKAWILVREQFPDAWLCMVGSQEPQDPVDQTILNTLVGDTRVCMVGDVADTAPLYAAADLLVLPTYREGFPNVLLEAAAMQLPVIASDIPGCWDAVERDITGTLVPVRDVSSLAKAMARYLSDQMLRGRHGTAARNRVLHQFRQEFIWESVYKEYQHLLARKGLNYDF